MNIYRLWKFKDLEFMPIPETEQWYVMRTVGHQTERAIGLRLEEAGIKHFIPLEKKLRKYKDGHKAIVTTPVVGGLLFCCGKESRIDEQVLRSGRRLQWVYQRGKDSSHHMVVPTDEMENFIRAVTSGLEEIHYLPISDANAFAGRMVRLHGGPMDG
ncbi:MAG: hypothetical protein HUK03_07115, partial [Bacteroidaceae bacterium]|nr:hypothetical protein [Bacteroidaceae bacterium]